MTSKLGFLKAAAKKAMPEFAVGGYHFLMALASAAHLICKSYAYIIVDNPAYVSVVILTTPLWVMLYYKLVKIQTELSREPSVDALSNRKP